METHRLIGSWKHLEIVLLANIKGNFAPIHLMKINYHTWQIWCITTCVSAQLGPILVRLRRTITLQMIVFYFMRHQSIS